MKLASGIEFESLYDRAGLCALDAKFVDVLAKEDVALHNRLMQARAEPLAIAEKDASQLMIDLAPHVEAFIAGVFGIEKELKSLHEAHHALEPLYACKRLFVQRRAAKALKPEEAARISGDALLGLLPLVPPDHEFFELVFAKVVMGWLEDEEKNKSLLEVAARYAAWALYSGQGRARHGSGVLFRQPHKTDPEHLIPVETELKDGVTVMRLPESRRRIRHGFALTDEGGTLTQALDQAHYCIICHNQGKDSCSKGLKEKDGAFKKNTQEIPLAGCPLEEKISEMHAIKREGFSIGALAAVCIDNPLCAGTGHRICNDCMKACIYQKQEPVNIPLAETRVLDDVLALPFGFEIYSLLTRWNPLHFTRPVPCAETGKKVLVAGVGPAGYTLAHHLLNDGHTVVAVDGLKIEPLPEPIRKLEPIKDLRALYEPLDERVMAGFGGVAEYGITVRWDKNYLKIIRLLLERRAQFAMFGGVRFGSTLNYDDAFRLGFDHIALCLGAGKPTVLDIPNGMAKGVRTASDFLMALQLTGAARKDSIANLQLRLPVVVIGGGLTAVDTATEALAYYPVQVEKFLSRYEALVKMHGVENVRKGWNAEETAIADEFIAHATALRKTKDPFPLLDRWGGVKIVYRKRLIDAPSYRLNHEEVEKAFEEGMFFAEMWEPEAVEVDAFRHASAIRLKQAGADRHVTIPARTILVAAGTSPNTVLAREDAAHFRLDGKWFAAVDENGQPATPEKSAKPKDVRVLMAKENDGRAVSFFGDLHPSFAGNVVKAMASAKQGYPVVSRVLAQRKAASADAKFMENIRAQFAATVHEVNRLAPSIIEVVVKAPAAASRFEPGQFYRLQNYEMHAPRVSHADGGRTLLAMEGLAMTGAQVDKKAGLVSVIALEMGGSSDLCAMLKPGEPVVLMGPTGTPTEIPEKQTAVLAGGGLGNAVLFSIGAAMRAKGCRVLYFAAYRKFADRYKVEEIEKAADAVVWCCEEGALKAERPEDRSFKGNIIEAMLAYAKGELGDAPISMQDASRIIAIGSDRMMAAVAAARHGILKPFLKEEHEAIGSINSPMQCMMKEICGQCLQQHCDPATGKTHYVYSCFNQDQCLDEVVFPHLAERLEQNAVQEKLTRQWIDYCLKSLSLRPDRASNA